MPDFLGVLLANPVLFVEAGTALQSTAGELSASGDEFAATTAGMPGWHGEARSAQDGAASTVRSRALDVLRALEQAGAALTSGGATLTELTTLLRGQVDTILAEGFLVLASGLVVIGPAQEAEAAATGPGAPEVIAGYEAIAATYTADLDGVVADATVSDIETSERVQAAGAPIGLVPAGPSPLRSAGPPVPVRVWYENGMPRAEFDRKARALKMLSDRGMLFKAANPVARDKSITDGYRSFTIGRIRRLYTGSNPRFKDSLIDDVTQSMSPDHVHELQVGGPDSRRNLRFLHRFTNERIGQRQIWPQIRNLPDGTPISIEVF